MKRRFLIMVAVVVVGAMGAVAASMESVEQLLEEGRLDDAVTVCKKAEAAQGTTAEVGGNWLRLAKAMWNAGEHEGAGMVLERLLEDVWPEEVRENAEQMRAVYDSMWGAELGGDPVEVALAAKVMSDCYWIVSESVMEEGGSGFPEALESVPEWAEHVEGLPEKERELCGRIVWRPNEEKLATIELGGGCRGELLRGGGVRMSARAGE